MKRLKPQIIFWGTGVIVWVVAQSIVGRMPHIVYNERLAFSIVWPNAWIIPTVILFLVGIVWWFYRFRPTWPWASLSFGLILGGGASNLFERITNAGLVADYWDMYSFFTFNLADVSIAIGIVGLMIYFLHVRA